MSTNQQPAAEGGLEVMTGQSKTAVAIGDKLYHMKPMSPRMSAAVMAWERERALSDFFKAAKGAGLPGDIVSQEISRLRREDFFTVTSSTLAFVLHLRSGAPLEEVLELPQRELLKLEAEILERDDEPEADGPTPEEALRALGLDPDELMQDEPAAASEKFLLALEDLKAKKKGAPAD